MVKKRTKILPEFCSLQTGLGLLQLSASFTLERLSVFNYYQQNKWISLNFLHTKT